MEVGFGVEDLDTDEAATLPVEREEGFDAGQRGRETWSLGSKELGHLAGRSLRHQAPGAEHQDPVGYQQNAGIVGGKDHAAAVQADFPQGLDHDVRRLVIQLSCGLVGEDDVRIGCESAGHRDSLLLSE